MVIESKPRLSQPKLLQISIIPKGLLYRMILGKVKKRSKFFISEKDYTSIHLVGNGSLFTFILSFLIFFLITDMNELLSLGISLISSIAFLIVLGDYIRTKILNRHQNFEETAFLIINALSINMAATQSFPHSVELLMSKGITDEFYRKYFEKIVFNLNLGESEEEIIQNGSEIFLSKKYENAFQNIKSSNSFIDSDPDFLLRVKRGIKLIEDNIVIFIAVSCLFPLVLSVVLSFILPSNSLIVLIFPLLYAIFGTLILRFMHNRGVGDLNE